MVQRINVSVPDELYEEIQRYKDSLNLSGVFQNAVAEKIEAKEKYRKFKEQQKGGKDMQQIVSRLRKEKQEFETASYADGRKEGYELATELNKPIITTSANITGQAFMTSMETLHPDIKKKMTFIFYEGEKNGRPSSIVDLTVGEGEIIER